VPVAVASLDECMAAVGALVRFLLTVSFLMINHVAELRCLNMALETPKKLIRSASLLVDHVMFLEAHVAGIWAVPVADALLDRLLAHGHALGIIVPNTAALALLLSQCECIAYKGIIVLQA